MRDSLSYFDLLLSWYISIAKFKGTQLSVHCNGPEPGFDTLSSNRYVHGSCDLDLFWCSEYIISLITVFDAITILTGRQSGQKLQCLYGNPMANDFFQN